MSDPAERAFLGEQVVVTLSHEPQDVVIVKGKLLKWGDDGEIVVQDDMGFCHWCWPALNIEAL